MTDQLLRPSRRNQAIGGAVAALLGGLLLILILALTGPEPEQAGRRPVAAARAPGTTFWIQDANTVFDDQALSHIAENAGVVVLHTGTAAPTGGYPFEAIVKRLKAKKPDLQVLAYMYSSEYFKKSRWNDREMLQGFLQPRWLLSSGPAFGYADAGNEDYREWLAGRIREAIDRFGVDGVMLDESFRSPRRLPIPRRNDPRLTESYSRGMDKLFAEIRDQVGPRPVLFNGLWANQQAASLPDQEKLLTHATGASIEHFGCTPFLRSCRWERDVLPYLGAMRRHPDKNLFVFGRSPYEYRSYRQDYLHQRATYAAYLLMKGPRTTFKYTATFLAANSLSEGVDNRSYAGRSGGLDAYRDSQIELGSPRGPFRSERGVYYREFEEGIAAVNPPGGRPRSLRLSRPYITPEGERVEGSVELASGAGLVATTTAPAPSTTPQIDFERAGPPRLASPNASVGQEANNRFLRLRRLLPASEHLHDVLLDAVRTLEPPREIRLRVRTTDPRAALLFAAEVDDPIRKTPQVTVRVGSLSAGAPGTRRALFYRKPAIRTIRPKIQAGSLVADGRWHELRLSSSALGRYGLRRWSFLRPLGNVDLDDIRITDGRGR